MKHTSQSVEAGSSTRQTPWLSIVLVASAIDIGAWMALRKLGLGTNTRIALALAPVPGNAVLLVIILRAIRRLDEFQKRIQFEAVAAAFLLTGLAVFIFGYLQQARIVGSLNVGLVWLFMALAYGLGYVMSVRHYQ